MDVSVNLLEIDDKSVIYLASKTLEKLNYLQGK